MKGTCTWHSVVSNIHKFSCYHSNGMYIQSDSDYVPTLDLQCNLIGLVFLIIINCRCARNADTTCWTGLQPTTISANLLTAGNVTAFRANSTHGSTNATSIPATDAICELWCSTAKYAFWELRCLTAEHVPILLPTTSYDAPTTDAANKLQLSSTTEYVTNVP